MATNITNNVSVGTSFYFSLDFDTYINKPNQCHDFLHKPFIYNYIIIMIM